MGKKKQEPKFYVMDPTADETAQEFRPMSDMRSAFDGFPKLKQAVRYILAAENTDEPWTAPKREILDENGDTVTVDWDADEYKTRYKLAAERDSAAAARNSAQERVKSAEAVILKHQKQLIDAGLIPVELLHRIMVSYDIDHNHHTADLYSAVSVPMRQSMDARIRFAVPAHGTAEAYAFDKLLALPM